MLEIEALTTQRILITGAAGMLGTALTTVLHSEVPTCRVTSLSHAQLDVTDSDAVMAAAAHQPDIIIHCAAKVDADYCEKNPDQCHDVMVSGTRHVIELAKQCGARICYPQSFLVYDGKTLPITQTTAPAPLSVYGRNKWQAEQLLCAELPGSLIVRMGGFFGGGAIDKNFVGKFALALKKNISQGTRTIEVGERIWHPTYTMDLAANTLLLLAQHKSGVYLMAARDEGSFYDIACFMVEQLGLSDRMAITPRPADMPYHDIAQRPERATMICDRLQSEGLDRQRTWRDSLAEYLRDPYFKELFA